MLYRSALFALICGTCAAQGLHDQPSVAVLLRGEPVPESVLGELEHEVESAVASSGVKLSWISGTGTLDSSVPGQLVIVEMHGACRLGHSSDSVPLQDETPLGQTHVVNGQVLPIADVLCDSVRKLVENDLRAFRPERRDKLFGRALGRVAAHELYHILLRTADHGREGLSRSRQTSAALLAPRGSFTPIDERKIADSVGADANTGGR